MKKLFVLALMAAMISTAAFAQLVFSGYINSGAGVATNNVSGTDPAFAVRGVDSEQNGYRFRLNGQYTNEAKTVGARFRLQMQGGGTGAKATGSVSGTTGSNTVPSSIPAEGYPHTHSVSGSTSTDTGFSVSHAWAWINFFDGVIQINGGRIEESTWGTGDIWLNPDSVQRFAGDGALLKIMPIDGLILGAGIYATGRDGTQIFQDLKNAKITGHLAYTLKDVFRVDVSYRTDTYEKVDGVKVARHSGSSGDGPSMLFADVRLLMLKELTAIIAAQLNNLDDFDKIGTMTFSETFGYKITDDLSVGLNAVQFMSNVKKYDIGLLFNPWIAYKFDNIVPRLDAVYFIAGSSNFTSGLNNHWHRRAFTAAGDNDYSVINIRPSVAINVDNRTKLEIGDSLYFDNTKVKGEKNVMTNVFYIDLVLSF